MLIASLRLLRASFMLLLTSLSRWMEEGGRASVARASARQSRARAGWCCILRGVKGRSKCRPPLSGNSYTLARLLDGRL
jgi:hypothetical protein